MMKRDKLGRFVSTKKTAKRAVAKKPMKKTVKSVKNALSKKPTKKVTCKTK